MLDKEFSLAINAQNVIQLAGHIYIGNVKIACANGCAMINNVPKILVDLSGVIDADSSSLAMLVEWVRAAKLQNKEIMFNNLPQFMLDLGRVCGLDAILPIGRIIKFDN